ncbi:Long-chain-fatty-acid--CoA ligase [Symmachiella macrocystis]|uniref:Long-chain-fatty-acid--CoA ligase n=1 Tax=Symmachiella macrocystis TaxID=2527985 RepID=A0A5C6BQI9_9PLAN|nr:AMP-binding protein [Symmachiella macrocystis]TWU13962.1 Long-chain-fatty-acid--CoA ligase [Symmachiella macrocystis]
MTAAASPLWIDGLTIGEMLRETAQRSPDADALVFPQLDRRWSYTQLDADVDHVARGLLALGVETGSHVAVWATNWPQWVLLQFATARIGAVLVTINPAYRAFELQYVLKQADIDTLFLLDKFRGSDYRAMLNEAVPELVGCDPQNVQLKDFPKLRHVIAIQGEPTVGMLSWELFLKGADTVTGADLSERESHLKPADAINIQFTSGTTGFPKGATLTHRNLLLNAYYIGQCQQLTAADRICIPVPFYHCFGCVLGVLGAAVRGAAMIIPAEHFDAEATLAAIAAERATSIYGVPTMFIAQLDHSTRPALDLSSLRTGIMAGSPCPIEVMQRVVDELGAREITIAYGLTEASPVITQTRTDDPLELRVKTVGRPLPDVEVKIVDPANGEELGDEQQGELCARGHVVMLGYYQMPDATAAAIDDDGWLHSGDLAVRLPNGYYRITGRMKDMVCRGGENIYPREIEEFLYTHPAVGDVAVVGVPDAKYVEELAVWIRLKPDATLTEQDVQQFCRSSLAHYKVPRYVKFVTGFPQTVTGKIQKFKIRETMIAELGLNESETA